MPRRCISGQFSIILSNKTSCPLTVAISTGASIASNPNSCLCSFHLHLQVLLCSLTGDIFPKEGQHSQHSQQQAGSNSSSMRKEHLRGMVHMVWVWVPDPQAAVHQAAANEEAFLLDACRHTHCLFACTANLSMLAFVKCSVCYDASLMVPCPQRKVRVLIQRMP